jgi:hypothetical protein
MPLFDHFHGEIEIELPWPTLAQAWAVSLMSWLNRTLPRDDFHALTNIRMGSQVEADVAEYRLDELPDPNHVPNGTVATLTTAPPALITIQATFPDEIEVEVRERRSGRPLVGVIELISPGNKKEKDEKESFIAKCIAYLKKGIGLVLIDVVTDHKSNFHNDLMKIIGGPSPVLLPESPTYVSGYRPVHRRKIHKNEIEIWPYQVTVGQTIPAVPFGLRGGPVVVLNLESTYSEAIRAGGL